MCSGIRTSISIGSTAKVNSSSATVRRTPRIWVITGRLPRLDPTSLTFCSDILPDQGRECKWF